MRSMFLLASIFTGVIFLQISQAEVPTMPCEIQVYTMASQVNQYLSTSEGRQKVLAELKRLGINKIYLEAVRSGHRAKTEAMVETRDFFRQQGLQVAAGVATVPGPEFGTASDRFEYAMNYETPETRQALQETFEFCAQYFDEIMVDDFLMTDDESEVSQKARGDRTWSSYRLDLMTTIARDVLIGPAKKVNPKVQVINKYPQWYDRFHMRGYNVISGPELFDTVWVGTETRNPETEEFGYVQPTEGFINYSWLDSLGKGKTRGAWFDTIDCTPEVFLMQGYQSVLAGADKIVIFNLGEIMESNPVLNRLWQHLEALEDLAHLVAKRKCVGLCLYKPPHSEPGRDVYLFDYLATLGLPIEMTGIAPEKPQAILLSAHAASDPQIITRLRSWLDGNATVFVTPGFLEKASSRLPTDLLGSYTSLPGTLSEVETSTLSVGGKPLQVSSPLSFVNLPGVSGWNNLISFEREGTEVPVLSLRSGLSAGKVVLLNISTFTEDVFGKEEFFLAPRKLMIPQWPRELANAIREQIPLPVPLHVDAAPPFGLYLYGTDTLAVANFQATDLPVKIEIGTGQTFELTIPAWQVVTKSF